MFENTAKPIEKRGYNYYGFDKVSIYLFTWSRLFQSVISQSGTYLLTKKFHTQECGIYKAEGGCRIVGFCDLVLGSDCCYWDHYDKDKKQLEKLDNLITHVVLNWNPNNPIVSMLYFASEFTKVSKEELEDSVRNSNISPFSGNALSRFFDWNPFSEPIHNKEYLEYCKYNSIFE